ncbi:MAG: hypothetical protein SGI90_00775 [Candidatus Eisenbacteria bacterium]|nr:hypothetical protein [Candidatus Eisenbacteria bacterium]
MMTRLVLHLTLILAFMAGGLVPAGLSRCQVKMSCCGCGPAIEAGGCCCGPEVPISEAPARSKGADIQFDWAAQVGEPVSGNLFAPLAAAAPTMPACERATSAPPVPLYLSYHAFLI